MKEFFGQKGYLEILRKRVSGLTAGYRQNLAIIGDELVGKTSLLFNFLQYLHNNRIIPVYLEVRPESQELFCRRFIGALLYNFLLNSGLELREDLDYLLKKAQNYIPNTAEKIKHILQMLSSRKKSCVFSELFGLCELIHEETSKSCLIILDEFHNLETLGFGNLYREWCKLLILQKNTMYIIVSSLKFKTKSILSKNLSLLFGNFELINVEPFDIKTSLGYLNQRLHTFELEEGLKNFIIHFTGGFPLYLEVISEELLKSPSESLAQIIEDELFQSSGTLHQRFSNYLKRFTDSPRSQEFISILHMVACGHNRTREIASILHKTKREVTARLNRLLELDTITKSGDFLKINDRVFGFWLRFVYQEKMRSLTFDARNQQNIFKQHIVGMIEEFQSDARKSLSERVAQVAQLFEDETLQIEKKRIRLSHFREIKPLEFNRRNLKEGLLCRSKDSLWIMAFKPDGLSEEDVADFAKECRKYRHKRQSKILVSLKDIETNARLRAMEEKILTWDLDNLNHIFDLFSKPRVIA